MTPCLAVRNSSKGVWLFMRMACDGAALKGKVWQDGKAEPGWQMTHAMKNALTTSASGPTGWIRVGVDHCSKMEFDEVVDLAPPP